MAPIALISQRKRRDMEAPDQKTNQLRRQIEERDYSIDPNLVAQEILRKLRLVKAARGQLASGAGQSR